MRSVFSDRTKLVNHNSALSLCRFPSHQISVTCFSDHLVTVDEDRGEEDEVGEEHESGQELFFVLCSHSAHAPHGSILASANHSGRALLGPDETLAETVQFLKLAFVACLLVYKGTNFHL